MRRYLMALVALLVLGPGAAAARAQGLTITPRAGVYLGAGDARELRAEARRLRVDREADFALGLTVGAGPIRGGFDYVTGKRISDEGLDDGGVGEGSLLAAALAFDLRPLPRIIGFQPYGVAGLGVKHHGYAYDKDGLRDLFPSSDTEFSLQAGLGADLAFGAVGVTFEATDYISLHQETAGRHDAFLTVGLRIGLR